NNTYNIFNEDRKGNGGSNVNADDLYRELDERIDRLDAIIRALLKGEITENNRKVLAEALRQLKNEEEAKRLNGTNPQPVEGTIDLSRHFHLVVGGFVYRENAERFVAKLKAQGFNEAVIIGVFNGYFLVRLKDYATLQEAIDAQQKYKFIVDGIWVHKWP
ncbi:MAG: SPOR domain-containing protein, partial [Flavobacteriia bacterium]